MNEVLVLNIQLFQSKSENTDFYFSSLKDHLRTSHKYIEKAHRHDFYVTVFFTEGTGIHEIDFTKYEIQPGCIFFLSPGQVHSWKLLNDIDGYIFFHSQSFYEQHYISEKLKNFPFFSSIQFTRKLNLNCEQKDKMFSFFLQLNIENSTSNLYKSSFICSVISLIYVTSVRLYAGEISLVSNLKKPSYIKHFQIFEELIEIHFLKEKSVQKYAEMMQISSKHLNRITQTVVHKTASDLILDRVILEAKRMLIYLDESLSDIAFTLGYEEYSYFVRTFKKSSGLTPTQFIKQHR